MERKSSNESPAHRLKHLNSSPNVPFFRSESTIMDNFEVIMRNNRIWSEEKTDLDPEYF